MTENIVDTKSYNFAIKIINLYKEIISSKKEYILSKQILRSGTSIGANVTEAENGFSKSDFSYKMNIAFKEAGETRYWLNLLKDTNFIDDTQYNDLIGECNELCAILCSIVKTASKNL